MGSPYKSPLRLSIFRQFASVYSLRSPFGPLLKQRSNASVCERSEFSKLPLRKLKQSKDSDLTGVCFLCLLSFTRVKESKSPSAKPDLKNYIIFKIDNHIQN